MKSLIGLIASVLIMAGVFGIGCAHAPIVVKLNCPSYPIMLPVTIEQGTIKGKDLDNVIENHKSLWKHIHVIEKLGCTSRKS